MYWLHMNTAVYLSKITPQIFIATIIICEKVCSTCYIVSPYMSQTRDQQCFTISEVAADRHEPWCRSASCGHPLPALTDNWTHGAASRHTIAPISHTRPSPRSRSYYSFPVSLRVGGRIGLNIRGDLIAFFKIFKGFDNIKHSFSLCQIPDLDVTN